ncbi:trafficking protein particle complex subunit 14 [Patella vulgata]|uniref:trafficking protein particle complex subunit 14 n=1 Tax=Patella vulgata TaxID=6465 RepID=UPI00217F315B|nr:trafficking protein particle complex subunit 14 [Patella vulgata]
MDGYINRVNLNVSVWMCTSPLDQTPDQIAKKDFHLDNLTLQVLKKKTVQQKTVSKELNVINPPLFKIKVTTAGGKHLLLVHVCNKSNESVELIDLNILNTSSKYSVEESGSHVLDTGNNNNLSSEHITSRIHFNKLGSTTLPCSLLPEEEMSFIFNLSLENFNSSISELELYFKSQLKWRHSSSVTNVITVYRLPKFCVHYAPFIISIGCSENITVGKSFTLTYNIVNKLQDFLSMKLYWSLKHQLEVARQKGDNDGNRQRLEMMNRAVICHDPDIHVGSCPRGSSVPVPVSFQILEPGLFEFSDLMKVNLRYALPDSQSTLKQDSLGTPVSIDTTSTLSTEDQLAASEELWRDRSGSTSSLNTPTSESAEEKRKSFATKSYSFGDLGPTLSTDSDEARRKRFKNIKRSSAVPPPRPPPPRLLTQVEKDVTNPSNFLKKSFQVYIPHHV